MSSFWIGVLVGCGGCISGLVVFGLAMNWWLDHRARIGPSCAQNFSSDDDGDTIGPRALAAQRHGAAKDGK